MTFFLIIDIIKLKFGDIMEIFIGKKSGFCYGVKRAYDGALENVKKGKIYCLGEIVHNSFVIHDLESKGVTFIDDINECNLKNKKLLLRAHGVAKEVYEECEKLGAEVLDYTCPNVKKIHDIVNEYADNGHFVILCGSKTHPENIGTISFARKNSFILESENDIDCLLKVLENSNLKKVLLISQTTFSVEKFEKIKNVLSEKLENYELVIKNTICNATKLNQDETNELSKVVDYMIVVGGKNSSNTLKLYDISKKNLENTILVQSYKDIDFNLVKKYEKIGIVYGASTPNELIDEIVEKLQD